MLKFWKWLQLKFHGVFDWNKDPIRSYVLKPGQKVWELDLKTLNVVEADVEVIEKFGFGPGHKKEFKERKVVVKENCIYEFAINGENAVRKFEKRIVEHYKK